VSTVGFITASNRGGRGAAGGLAEGDGAMGAPPQPLLGMRVEGPLRFPRLSLTSRIKL
jgi:hypothetical protein